MSRPAKTTLATWATFALAGETYALRVDAVHEVLVQHPLTPVPLAPDHVVGLLNLRGQVMPAIDLRRRLGLPPRDAEASWLMMVVRSAGRSLGVVVDDIGDVLELPDPQWRPPPPTMPRAQRELVLAICPIEGRMVLALSPEGIDESPERSA